MFSYLAIFATSMAGHQSAPLWIVPVATLVLSMISVAENRDTYRSALALGYMGREAAARTVLQTVFNSAVAILAAYAIGYLIGMTS